MSESGPERHGGTELDLEALAAAQKRHAQERESSRLAEERAAQTAAESQQRLIDYQDLNAQRAVLARDLHETGFTAKALNSVEDELLGLDNEQLELQQAMEDLGARLAQHAQAISRIQGIIGDKPEEEVAPEVLEALDKARGDEAAVAAEIERIGRNLEGAGERFGAKSELAEQWQRALKALRQSEKEVTRLFEDPAVRESVMDEANRENERREGLVTNMAMLMEGTGDYGRTKLGGSRERFLKEALQIFLTEDLEAKGLTSLADYDTEGLLTGIREGGGAHNQLRNGGFGSDFLKQHADALNRAEFLRGILASNPPYNNRDNTTKRLALIDSPKINDAPMPVYGSAEKAAIVSHLRTLNYVKAASEGAAVSRADGSSITVNVAFEYNGREMVQEWNKYSSFNPLTSLNMNQAPNAPIYPKEWEADEAGRLKIEEIQAVYTQRFEQSQQEARQIREEAYRQDVARKLELEAYFVKRSQEEVTLKRAREVPYISVRLVQGNLEDEREGINKLQLDVENLRREREEILAEKPGLLNIGRRKQLRDQVLGMDEALEDKQRELRKRKESQETLQGYADLLGDAREITDGRSRGGDPHDSLVAKYREVVRRVEQSYPEMDKGQ